MVSTLAMTGAGLKRVGTGLVTGDSGATVEAYVGPSCLPSRSVMFLKLL